MTPHDEKLREAIAHLVDICESAMGSQLSEIKVKRGFGRIEFEAVSIDQAFGSGRMDKFRARLDCVFSYAAFLLYRNRIIPVPRKYGATQTVPEFR